MRGCHSAQGATLNPKPEGAAKVPNNEMQLRRLRAISRAVCVMVAKYDKDGDVHLSDLAGLYDSVLHVLETGAVPEGRAAFEMGFTMGHRGRPVKLAAEIAARIWPDDGVEEGAEPPAEMIERICKKIEAMAEVPSV